MGELFKKKWVEISINAIISGLMILLAFSLNAKRADSQELTKKIETKAEKTYVDQQDGLIKENMKTLEMNVDKTINRIDNNLQEIRQYIMKGK